MGIGAASPAWRRVLLKALSAAYIRRRCRTEDGLFEAYVSGGSRLRVLDPRGLTVEAVHRRFIHDCIRANDIVWDIGGNLGLFAFPAALKAGGNGRVYCFEPDIELAANLLRSKRLRRNRRLNVVPICAAISDVDGGSAFQISKFSRAMNKLQGAGRWHDDQVSTEEVRTVPTLRIDTLADFLMPPSVIKIDVEGAEIQVLSGGSATIAKYRPTILIEGPSEIWPPMQEFFGLHDYVLYDGDAGSKVLLSHPVWDTVAVPREKFQCR